MTCVESSRVGCSNPVLELHDVRDFLGHANITTTSRYLRSTTLRFERALTLLEEYEQRQGRAIDQRQGQKKSRKSSTLVPQWREIERIVDAAGWAIDRELTKYQRVPAVDL